MPEDVSPVVACPSGPLGDAVAGIGVEWHRLPEAEASLRLDPIHTPIGVAALATGAVLVRLLARRVGVDLLHGNSVRASLVAALAARLGAPPAIAHVRDCLPPGRVSAVTLRAATGPASVVLANSDHTRRNVQTALAGAGRTPIRVAYSPVDVDRFDPLLFDRAEARAGLGLAPTAPVLAVVGQLTPWKGQDDAVRIVASVKRTHPDVRLLLVGTARFVSRATRYDNQAYVRRLQDLVDAHGVRDQVRLLGERPDVPAILRAVDLLLVPSWEEPFGRVVVEAMAMGVPVLATSVGGPSEVLRSEIDGVLLPPRHPELWAAEIAGLLDDPQRRSSLGVSARKRALQRFSLTAHVDAVLAAYRAALEGPGH
ncbi:MAG: glycosyltransferase family 4 protein [Actinomycetota bacterium]|nr:glycosyltransferase family 4 protein [Actinomycetota bacterium]